MCIRRRFFTDIIEKGYKPQDINRISSRLEIPVSDIKQVLEWMKQENIMAKRGKFFKSDHSLAVYSMLMTQPFTLDDNQPVINPLISAPKNKK